MCRKYPSKCGECGTYTVLRIPHDTDMIIAHDDVKHNLKFPGLHVLKCWQCGSIYYDNITDVEINEGIRRQLGLLQPFYILSRLYELGKTVENLQEYLGPKIDLTAILDERRIASHAINFRIWRYLNG